MPQGHRKTPFSGKQKKAQIAAKRQNKITKNQIILKGKRHSQNSECDDDDDKDEDDDVSTIQDRLNQVQKIHSQPSRDNRAKPNRYALQFYRESDKELKEQRIDARNPLTQISECDLEEETQYFVNFDFPRRPGWNFKMSKVELDRTENRYFTEYVKKIEADNNPKDLSYFELNLETWRQLWRVLEISDIILIIVDIRYPNLMFPPSLFDYVTKELKKDMILVLNKIDLAPSHLVLGWKKYFQEKYENLKIVMFTSFPSYNLRGNQVNNQGLQIRRRRGKMKMAMEGAMQVLNVCKEIVKNEVDLTSWEQKIIEEMNQNNVTDENDDSDELIVLETTKQENDFDYKEHQKYINGILTIGCVGFPNVGKSSLLNGLMAKKVVSVSKTPGHTKHFQTIFLTNNVRLCDCPGLVFPSSTPRKLQVLMGSYPIAQLREPYGAIKYLAERINIPKLLNLKHLDDDDDDGDNKNWSAIDICDSWAIKRGFLTAKAARPDTYRAANSILRMTLEGKISLCLRPPKFKENSEKFLNDPELANVIEIQALGKCEEEAASIEEECFSSDGDDQEKNNQSSDSENDETIPTTKNAFSLLNDE